MNGADNEWKDGDKGTGTRIFYSGYSFFQLIFFNFATLVVAAEFFDPVELRVNRVLLAALQSVLKHCYVVRVPVTREVIRVGRIVRTAEIKNGILTIQRHETRTCWRKRVIVDHRHEV